MPKRLSNGDNMRFLSLSTLYIILCLSVAACQAQDNQSPTSTTLEQDTYMVTIKTNHGDITLELDNKNAPVTVQNFLSYVESGHYNGTIFHRVISNFMIQGGGFEPGMKQKGVNAPIPNEANNGLKNDQYTVAMARTGDPHSATAQFFINVQNNDFLNYSSQTTQGWGYAVFAKVTEGTDVIEKIKTVETGQNGPHGDVPVEDVIIESVSVLSDS